MLLRLAPSWLSHERVSFYGGRRFAVAITCGEWRETNGQTPRVFPAPPARV
jgi:hypothetical protein